MQVEYGLGSNNYQGWYDVALARWKERSGIYSRVGLFCVCVKHHFSTHELSMSVSIGEDEYFKLHPVRAPLQPGLKTGCD